MSYRVAFDLDVLKRFLRAAEGDEKYIVEPEGLAAVRIYLYAAKPLIIPSVRDEITASQDPIAARWATYHFDEADEQDDFYVGCVKGRAQRYLDYHPDPRNCQKAAEAECAKADALITLNSEFLKGLGGRTESIALSTPEEYWRSLDVAPGAPPRVHPGDGHPLAAASWWRW